MDEMMERLLGSYILSPIAMYVCTVVLLRFCDYVFQVRNFYPTGRSEYQLKLGPLSNFQMSLSALTEAF